MAKKLEKSEKEGRRSFFKPKEGTEYLLRVIPPENGDPFHERFMHYGLGKAFVCPKKTYGDTHECPACDLASALWDEYNKTQDPKTKELAKSVGSKQRFYTQVLVREDEKAGAKIYSHGKTVYQTFLKLCNNADYGDISHPTEGVDLTMKMYKPDKKAFPQTDITPKRKSTPLVSADMEKEGWTVEKLMVEAPKVSDEVSELPVEEIQARVDGWTGQDKEEPEETKYADKEEDSQDSLADKLKAAGEEDKDKGKDED